MKNPNSQTLELTAVSPGALEHRDFKPSIQGHTATRGKNQDLDLHSSHYTNLYQIVVV